MSIAREPRQRIPEPRMTRRVPKDPARHRGLYPLLQDAAGRLVVETWSQQPRPVAMARGQGQTVIAMEPPEIRYVSIGDGDVAYQVLGEGPGDLLFCNSLGGHVDLIWQIPQAAEFLEKIATFKRVLHMDRRGSGASDAVPLNAIPTWEELAEDIIGVLDAAESALTDLMGVNEVGPIAVLFAAMHPERVGSLILINTAARYMEASDYPIGVAPAALDTIFDLLAASWGSDAFAAATNPTRVDDREFIRAVGPHESGVSDAEHGCRSDEVLLGQHGRAPVPAVGAKPDLGAPSHR